MIDHFCVLLKSGIVLFAKTFAPLVDAPVDALIRDVLLEERMGETSYTSGAYTLRWTTAPDLGVLLIVAYQKILQLAYVDEMLEMARAEFSALLTAVPVGRRCTLYPCAQFEPAFLSLLMRAEKSAQLARVNKAQRSFKETKKFAQSKAGSARLVKGGAGADDDDGGGKRAAGGAADDDGGDGGGGGEEEEADEGEEGEEEEGEEEEGEDAADGASPAAVQKKLARLAAARGGGGRGARGGRASGARGRGGAKRDGAAGGVVEGKPSAGESKGGKKGKELRTWHGGAPDESKTLNLSAEGQKRAPTELSAAKLSKMREAFGAHPDGKAAPVDLDAPVEAVADAEGGDDDGDGDDDDDGAAGSAAAGVATRGSGTSRTAPSASSSSMFGKALRRLNLAREIDDEDLTPVLAAIKDSLMSKNVAEEIALKLCDSVGTSLRGLKCASFTSVRTMAMRALEDALTRILTPRRTVDVLAEVSAQKLRKAPYVIVFLGVNGVGKSTTLSKVAYYLRSNGHSVLLCACDTFRSGAVEQLRVHGQCLDVPVFEKGYGRDASQIAADGIAYAKQQGIDAVLVDTAGRMQDNEPLMRALAKLVNANRPHLVLFVGEALVGNDSIDQVTKFNQALMDLSGVREPRLIDGMVLTKFDTIDDKVGAAISMVYVTGKPIVFVGVGQTYADIRNLNVKMVVKQLVK